MKPIDHLYCPCGIISYMVLYDEDETPRYYLNSMPQTIWESVVCENCGKLLNRDTMVELGELE